MRQVEINHRAEEDLQVKMGRDEVLKILKSKRKFWSAKEVAKIRGEEVSAVGFDLAKIYQNYGNNVIRISVSKHYEYMWIKNADARADRQSNV